MSAAPELTIVIPCRDDSEALASLLPQLQAQAEVEVIVVSETADPRTSEMCAQAGARHMVRNEERGARLRAAAGTARAANLWFLHADAELAKNAVEAVVAAFRNGQVGGYFRFRLSGPPRFAKKLIEFGVALRCRLGGIPYGDQGPFVTKRAYEAEGGHESLPLFDEFRLLGRLKRRPDFRAIEMTIGVDPKRWERNGYVRHIVKNRCLSVAYMLGASPQRLARWYYG